MKKNNNKLQSKNSVVKWKPIIDMELLLDGNSEHVAHVFGKKCKKITLDVIYIHIV